MNDTKTGNRLEVSAQGDREIVGSRVFDAPREVVFKTMLDPELIPEWWVRTSVDVMVVRVGGSWRFVSVGSDGSEQAFRGTYREITPHERVVQTFEWEGMPGYVSVETLVLEDLGDDRTRVTVTSIFHTAEERDGMLGSGMEEGWSELYDRLEELLASRASKPAPA